MYFQRLLEAAEKGGVLMCLMYIYIYIYILCMYTYIYIYIHVCVYFRNALQFPVEAPYGPQDGPGWYAWACLHSHVHTSDWTIGSCYEQFWCREVWQPPFWDHQVWALSSCWLVGARLSGWGLAKTLGAGLGFQTPSHFILNSSDGVKNEIFILNSIIYLFYLL